MIPESDKSTVAVSTKSVTGLRQSFSSRGGAKAAPYIQHVTGRPAQLEARFFTDERFGKQRAPQRIPDRFGQRREQQHRCRQLGQERNEQVAPRAEHGGAQAGGERADGEPCASAVAEQPGRECAKAVAAGEQRS